MPLSNIRQRLARWLAPETRGLAGPGYSDSGFAGSVGRTVASGGSIGPRTALSISAVWAAVNCYTQTLGSLDCYVAERDDRGGRRPAPYHPAFDLIRTRPNDRSTSMRFRQAWIGHALTFGNGYAEIVWDAKGRKPLELCLMDPRDVEVLDRRGALVYRQKSSGAEFPAEDVLHLAMFGFDGVRGYSPIAMGAETLGVAAAQRDYQAALFGNSAGIQGHIEVPGKINATARGELLNQWERRHQGASAAGLTGILDAGARWVSTAFSPQDADLILGAKFSVQEIARIFNLPPHKLGHLEDANYSTVEQMNIDFTQTSLMPWTKAIEQELDNKLLGKVERKSYFVIHDFAYLLRGDTLSETAREKSDIDTGIRSINEIRIARGYEPLAEPRADYHWVQAISNLEAIEDMGKAPADPAPPEAGPAPAAPGPESGPTPPPAASTASLRGVLVDALGRMLRREAAGARSASKRADFAGWVESPDDRRVSSLLTVIGPAAVACGLDARHVTTTLLRETRRQLRELLTSVPPEELPEAVDRLATRWEDGRAAAVADRLLNPPTEATDDEA